MPTFSNSVVNCVNAQKYTFPFSGWWLQVPNPLILGFITRLALDNITEAQAVIARENV